MVLYFALLILFEVARSDDNVNRIVGGHDAENGEFPYQISLRIDGGHFCGGSILNKNWILTAAHCASGISASRFTVVAGTTLLNQGGNFYEVERIVVHPEYSRETIRNDIALIKVKADIKFSNTVATIKLPPKNTEGGENLVVTGWGATSFPGNIPNRLQALDVLSITNQRCAARHGITNFFSSNICTFTRAGEGACHGDSGGPLAMANKAYQVGLVSWGRPCAVGYPDVFTRVFSYNSWIRAAISS